MRSKDEVFFFHRKKLLEAMKGKALPDSEPGRILQRMAEPIRLKTEWFSSHSMRVGSETRLAGAGFALDRIMQHVGWRSVETARAYARPSLRQEMEISAAVVTAQDESQPALILTRAASCIAACPAGRVPA
jgi:hypothetical protein